MSYQVLARKWRPKKFQEVIGQSHITRSLQNAISKDKVGHAYMFVGTRGVGKTSVARIFAKALRCEKITTDINSCGTCPACLDFDTETSMNVIEIDGASNNSVDNIRELISNVHYLPTSGKYKVYIIDEVHMLSTNAFNALLKTLEEPPAHVVFIFATTEAQKLLGTVLSRCQRFDFRNVTVEVLSQHVKEIANAEGIKFENDELIIELAEQGRGSVRDTLSLLDQVLTFSEDNFIKEEVFSSSLGVAGPRAIAELFSYLVHGKREELSKLYTKLLNENVPVKNVATSLLDECFNAIKNDETLSLAEKVWMYETMAKETTWIFNSIVPEKAFEILMYKIAARRSFFDKKIAGSAVATNKAEVVEAPVRETIAPKIETVAAPTLSKMEAAMQELAKEAKVEEAPVEVKPIVEAQKEVIAPPVVKVEEASATGETWEDFLEYLMKKSPATATNLEQGNILSPINLDSGKVFIDLGFNFSGQVFMDYLNEPEIYEKLKNFLADFYKVDFKNVQLNLKQVNSQESFHTQAQIREEKDRINHLDQVEAFKNNPLLKEAEKIFNSKVDKIILDPKKS